MTTVCAFNCHNLRPVCKSLRGAFPGRKIILMGDDDARTAAKSGGKNSGREAAAACYKARVIDGAAFPPFDREKDGLEGSDWNDFAARYGAEATERLLKERVAWTCMTEAQRAEVKVSRELKTMRHTLDQGVQLPKVEMVGGIFPKGHISAVIAAPGVGKTWFLQKFVSDLSIGGSIFDGFEDEPGPRRSLIFAGETGHELLIRRAAETRWPVNKGNVNIYSMIECEMKDISLDLDEEEGKRNIERAICMDAPEVVFFDTLSAFHSKDENKAIETKPILKYLLKLAQEKDIAIVLMHHTRKRKLAEQKFAMTQDEAIGSSVFNRLVAHIVGIEPVESDGESMDRENLVKVQKSWFLKFPPFTFKIAEGDNGRTDMIVDLDPKAAGGMKEKLWEHIERTYEPGRWFKAGELRGAVKLHEVTLSKYLARLIEQGRLVQRGERRGREYSVISLYERTLNNIDAD